MKYRLIKSKLKNKLLLNGFNNYSESNIFNKLNIFTKSTRRMEVSYTLKDDYFQVYVREYPGKEGWSRDKFKYNYKNIKSIINPR